MNTQQSTTGTTLPPRLTRQELLAELKIDRRTLYTWERLQMGPPFVRIGGRKFYPVDGFQEWLAARTSSAARTGRAR